MNGAQHIVYFDGVCNLCNASVDFMIRHDKKGVLRYASLQSEAGQAMLKRNGFDQTVFDSFVFESGNVVFVRSTAALEVAQVLGGLFRMTVVFYGIPRFIRDRLYDLLAKNRYRLFGKKESCRLPTPEERALFLD